MNRRRFLSLLAGVPVVAGAAALGIATPKAETQTIEGKKVRIVTDDLQILSPKDGQVYLSVEGPEEKTPSVTNKNGLEISPDDNGPRMTLHHL